ncbi:methyltransferase [Shewanella piezotolerans]|nr:methyltransferase [Shewanella piezotolerans]
MPQKNSHTSTFVAQLKQLDRLLCASRPLWQNRSFECKQLPWAETFPALAETVWQLADIELDEIDACQSRLSELLLPSLRKDLLAKGNDWDLNLLLPSSLTTATAIEPLLDFDDMAHFSAHIKGRKWQQIAAFSAKIPESNLPVLEWCAGKGHLGRLIAKLNQRSVTSLEWQQNLCDAGQQFADKWQLPQHFICADAFDAQQQQLKKEQLAVALHACGDLHVTLLKHAKQAGTKQLVISPCCYHLIKAKSYQPLSNAAKESELLLSRADLQLPLQQSTIASEKHKQYRLQEIAWRLAFDSLQREMRHVDEYLPVPAIKLSQLNGSFEAFCRWAATSKQVVLNEPIDWAHYQALGYERQRLTRRIDIVAHLFRAVLEKWLLLDRVCYLEESGYRVELSEFCANSVSPRNALISAFK